MRERWEKLDTTEKEQTSRKYWGGLIGKLAKSINSEYSWNDDRDGDDEDDDDDDIGNGGGDDEGGTVLSGFNLFLDGHQNLYFHSS